MKHYTNIFILIFTSIVLSACGSNTSVQNVSETGQNPLLIPALIDSRTTPEIELVMQNGAHEFYDGVQSETMGFNGDYLGPTIRLYRDTDVKITFTNNIGNLQECMGMVCMWMGKLMGVLNL